MSPDASTDDPSRSGWVSHRAVAWVLEDAPVPADLAWMLVVIARRCNEHGKGSFQTTKTMSAVAGKSTKQTQREVVQLRNLGLIVLGDQSLVAHLPAGKRPTVYDVPLHLKGPKPMKESRNKSGLRKDAGADTPPMDGTPPLHGTSPIEGDSTPPLDGVPTPPLQGRQKKPLNNPLNNPSSLSARTAVPAPRESADEDREREDEASPEEINNPTGFRERLVIKNGCPEHLATQVADFIEATNTIDGPGWWITADGNGTLAAQVATALAVTPGQTTDEASPAGPDCATCHDSGKVEVRNMYEGDSAKVVDCTDCTNNGRGRCRTHPRFPHRHCGPCRSDRIAAGNEQPRSGQRGQRGQEDVPPGYTRRPDGRLIMTNSHDPRIDWDFKV